MPMNMKVLTRKEIIQGVCPVLVVLVLGALVPDQSAFHIVHRWQGSKT